MPVQHHKRRGRQDNDESLNVRQCPQCFCTFASLDDSGKPVLTVIFEDWTTDNNSTDPILIVKDGVDFASLPTVTGTSPDTCLIFVRKATKLADVYAIRALMPPTVLNYYVYGD